MRQLLRAAFGIALFFVVLAALVIGAWVLYAGALRGQREHAFAAALAPTTGRWVDAGDSQVFVQEWGPKSGPALLLTHGTGAWSGTWFELPGALAAAGWHVVAIDLPPFGFSTHTSPSAAMDYSRTAQAKRVLRVVESLGERRVTLVGHSFGAGPALEAALLDSRRLRQVVLVDPALGLGPHGEPPACEPAPAAMEAVLGQRGLRTTLVASTATVPFFGGRLLRSFVHRKDAVTLERLVAYQAPAARFEYSAELGDWAHAFANGDCENAKSLRPESLTAWAAGGPPLALMWGNEDTITPIAQAQALRRWMPAATLTVLPSVGHIPHIEDPAAFSKALLAVLVRTP